MALAFATLDTKMMTVAQNHASMTVFQTLILVSVRTARAHAWLALVVLIVVRPFVFLIQLVMRTGNVFSIPKQKNQRANVTRDGRDHHARASTSAQARACSMMITVSSVLLLGLDLTVARPSALASVMRQRVMEVA
jgi:hypothetical protein